MGTMERLEKFPPAVLVLFSLVQFGLIVTLDVTTGKDLAFSIFYLAPISMIAWTLGRAAGLLTAGVGAVLWMVVDLRDAGRYSASMAPLWNAGVRLGFFIIVSAMLASLRKAHDHERTLARRDNLTGLLNARAFFAEVGRELERARRSGRPVTMAYMDLDHFKKVNDTFGHLVGDELLKIIAETMQGSLRATDLTARLGGDEFALFLPETGEERAREAVDRLRNAILERMRERNWPVTASIGAATFPRPTTDVETLVRFVDHLMYEVKSSGRNAVRHKTVGSLDEETAPAMKKPEAAPNPAAASGTTP